LQTLLDDLATSPPRCVLFWNVIPEYKLLIADALPDIAVWDVSPGEMLHASLQRWFATRRAGLPIRDSHEYAALLAGVVVKQQAEVEQACAAFGDRVHCIANGVPVPPSCPPRRVVSDGPIIIGTAARLHPHKRLEDLLDALRLMLDLNVELHIAGDADGDGETYAELLRRSAEGLPVRWLGAVEDMVAFHAGVDVIAVISEPAGCPNAIIEAMAAGLPVAATAVGGAMDLIVDGESGLLVPAREAELMADALRRLCSNAELRLRLGEAAWRRARDRFSVERMRDDYLRLMGLIEN
jgi:glycosyltransferase involved in cell wall biosynthesis